jgi:hypothetical protein
MLARGRVADVWRGADAAVRAMAASWFESAKKKFSSPRPPVTRPPYPRSVLFESLEQRILLSASPTALAAVSAEGVFTANLSEADDQVLIESLGGNAASGYDIRITVGAWDAETYTGVKSILADGAGGTDTFEFVSVDVPVDLMGEHVVLGSTVQLGSSNLIVNATQITMGAGAQLTTSGNVTLSASAERSITGSTSPAPVELAAAILVDGDITVGGALKLEAVVDNHVALSASGDSLTLESVTSSLARIGPNARVTAGTLSVSAITNTDLTLEVTDASAGYSGLGYEGVEAARNNATLLASSGPAKFYLWGATTLNTSAATYVVTHGWQSGFHKLETWIDLLNALKSYDPQANIVFTDWSEKSLNPVYPLAADDTFDIGTRLAQFLDDSGVDASTTTLIGHSLGGHVSGVAGSQYKALPNNNSIARIIALDPAGPFFEDAGDLPNKPDSHRLDATDATRVAVLHTTSILGYDAPLGHLDLYVNPSQPLQPGEASFIGSHSYATTLLTQLVQGKSFPQSVLIGGDSELTFTDLLAGAAGSFDVETHDTPIRITTIAAIEGGASIIVGTGLIPGSDASVLVQALDNASLTSSIETGTVSSPTAYDFVQAKIGLARDTQAYIGGAQPTTLGNTGNTATGLVRVAALNSGNITSEVASDFLEHKSSTFSRENLAAWVENADLKVAGLLVEAGSESEYATAAEENSNTVRLDAAAYVSDSIIAAGAAGVAVSAYDRSTYSALSRGLGSRMTLNDVRSDVSAYVVGSEIEAASSAISISAESSNTLNALATLGTSGVIFSGAGIFAINVANGSVQAWAEDSTLTTTGAGDITVAAANEARINAALVADAEVAPPLTPAALSIGAGMAFNAVGWDMMNVLLATFGDFLGDPASEWLEGILPVANETPFEAKAYLLDCAVVAAGDLCVEAISAPQINATVSTAAQSTASSLYGAASAAAAGLFASNRVNSAAEAYISYASLSAGPDADVSVGGTLIVSAEDAAGIYANSKVVSTSITTNDGGANIFNDVLSHLLHDYTTAAGSTALAFGDRVLLEHDYAEGGIGGRVYQFMGAGDTRNLGQEDYSDLDWWKEILETTLVPEGNNLSDSDAVALGGLVVLNDVRSAVLAKIENAIVEAADGDVHVSAITNATIEAKADSTATASGGSAYGTGTVLAVNGTIATNVILSQADAYIRNSRIEADDAPLGASGVGNVSVYAENTSAILAEVLNATTSGDTAGGATLAFNTIGWQAQNILFRAFDALLTTDLGTAEPAGVRAYLLDTTVAADGDVSVTAVNSAVIEAHAGNEATSAAAAIYGATGMAVSGMLASNMVASEAKAYIAYSAPASSSVDIDAGGAVTIEAQDAPSIVANTRVLAVGETVNDGGASLVNNFANAFLGEYRYTTKSGSQTLQQWDKVRLASDFAGSGAPGAVYQYTGTTPLGPVNLASQNYTTGPWVRLEPTNIIPSFGNVSSSDSMAVGVLVVRNDVRGGAEAWLDQATVEAGELAVRASEQASIIATAESAASASGGSLLGAGTVLAANGAAATNLVLSDAVARITRSDVTAHSGDVAVEARNDALIDARMLAQTQSGDTALGVVLAFNTIGWEAQNLLFNALDALIGRPAEDFDYLVTETLSRLDPGDRVKASNNEVYRYIGSAISNAVNLASDFYADATQWVRVLSPFSQPQPARVEAYIAESVIEAQGDVRVGADNMAQINATVSNAASSAASALYDATGAAFGGILASNKVASGASAYIEDAQVDAGGAVLVIAHDNAGIYANSKMVADSTTTNDGGLSLIAGAVNDVIPAKFRSDEGVVAIAFGDRVRLADDFDEHDYASEDGEQTLAQNDRIRLAADYAKPTFSSDSGVRLLRTGDVVQLADDYQGALGTPGGLYRFVGEGSRGLRIDLSAEDYNDTDRWQAIGGTSGALYEYLGSGETLDLNVQDYGDDTLWREIVGSAREVYRYMGTANPTFNLAAADFSDIGLWKLEPATQVIPTGISFTPSDSKAIGGLVVLNDVRSEVEAYISEATVTAVDGVAVQAFASAVIRAETDAAASSSGGDVWGKGDSLAVSAVVATNIVLSAVDAYVSESDITTTGSAGADVVVEAQNISQIDATTRAVAMSGGNSAAFLLAFNTIGWRAQNLLFNTLDALLGMTMLDGQDPARVAAHLLDTSVTATGGLAVTADSSAHVNALVTNDATSFPSAFFGAEGMSASGILSSNMVNSRAEAYIDYGTPYGSAPDIDVDGAVSVTAQDDAAIFAETRLYAEVSPTNDAGAGLLNNLAGLMLDDYQYTNRSGVKNLQFGDKVRVTDDHFSVAHTVDGREQLASLTTGQIVKLADAYEGGQGSAGSMYKFIGATPAGEIDLAAENYLNPARWQEVGGTYQYMGTAASGAGANLGTQDYSDFGYWKRLNHSNLITDSVPTAVLTAIGTVTKKEGLTGDANSYYGLIDRNDVRSEVAAYVRNANVSAAELSVVALESAQIIALEESVVVPWTGIGGVIATNNVLSKANAFISASTVATTDGDVVVEAFNFSLIDASTRSQIEAWDAKSAVLAFNAVGWQAQNLLFNVLDALLGDPLTSTTFNGERPAEVQAYILGSAVSSAGDVSVTAVSSAQINAVVGNKNVAEAELDIVIPGLMDGADGVAGGGVLASNKVSSFARAYIDFPGARGEIAAAGAVTVHAEDFAGITSESIVLQRAVATNTLAGIVDQVNALLPGDYDYTTKSGSRLLSAYIGVPPPGVGLPGDRVRIADDYDVTKGDRGAVYEYRGPAAQLDLGTQDYKNNPLWHKLVGGADNLEDLYPGIGNLTKSDATAVGILIVMNDVRSAVDAYIDNATVTADEVTVHALENAYIAAHAETNVEASGGSFLGKGSVLAVNGQVVTNVVLSKSHAFIRDSEIAADGNVTVEAANTSGIDATILAATSTGDTGVGVTLAFNTIGWKSQNFLLNALDTIIGRPLDDYDYTSAQTAPGLNPGDRVKHGTTVYWFVGSGSDSGNSITGNVNLAQEDYTDFGRWIPVKSPFGGEQPATTEAYILNSSVEAGGDLTVAARSEAQLNATVSNAASSNASAFIDATGKSIGGILASNKVSTSARAYIERDEYDYTTATGSRPVLLGTRVQLAGDYANGGTPGAIYEFVGDNGIEDLLGFLTLGLNLGELLDPVKLAAATLNLGTQNYADTSNWKLVSYPADIGTLEVGGNLTVTAEDSAGIFANVKLVSSSITTNDGGTAVLQETLNDFLPADFLSSEGTRSLVFGDLVRVADDHDPDLGDAGVVYQYMGTAASGSDLDLSTTDYTDLGYWKPHLATQLIPQGLNFTGSDSMAIGGLLVLNDVRAAVEAYLSDITAGADGDVLVSAVENATIIATADSTVESSGGSVFGEGKSLAVNATIATNVVLAGADAYIVRSHITASGGAGTGDVTVEARNEATIDATTLSATSSGDTGVGVVLAFNAIGWPSRGLLFNTLDALLGLSETSSDYEIPGTGSLIADLKEGDRVKNAAGKIYRYIGEAASSVNLVLEDLADATRWREVTQVFAPGGDPARARAYLQDAHVAAAGTLSVTAESAAQVSALVSTETTSIASAWYGAKAIAGSGVLASNKVASLAQAYIDDGNPAAGRTIHADAGIVVEARDAAGISAESAMGTTAKRTNDLGAGLINNLVNQLRGEYRYTSNSGTRTLHFGDLVRVADDYGDDAAGNLYQYMGTSEARHLGAEDYLDFEYWKEITETNLIPGSVATVALKSFGLDAGSSKSYYAMVTRNDVRGEVESRIDNAVVTTGGDVMVTAHEEATLEALDRSTTSAQSGATGGLLVTNQMQSGAGAFIRASDVSADGSVRVEAQSRASVDAISTSAAKAAESIGVVAVFNSIGWDASNILFQAIDALLGADLLTNERPASAHAFILNSTVDAGGDVDVIAESATQLNATVGNEQVSSATNTFAIAAKYGAKGMAAGGLLASNRVSSEALAYIEFEGAQGSATAGGTVTVAAKDTSGIEAASATVISSITTNTLDAVKDILIALLPGEYDYTTASGEQLVFTDTRVRLGADYAGGGDGGAVYRWVGEATELDLGTEDYSAGDWVKVTAGRTTSTISSPSSAISPTRMRAPSAPR